MERISNAFRDYFLSWAAMEVSLALDEAVSCIVCDERVSDEASLTLPRPCNHTYCSPCLRRLCEAACDALDRFPPRCCRVEVPATAHVEHLLGSRLALRMARTRIEARDHNRVYCAEPRCSAYLPRPREMAARSARDLQCDECGTRTCMSCKERQHDGSCIVNPAVEQTLLIARANGWMRCFRCKAVVERIGGCVHMT